MSSPSKYTLSLILCAVFALTLTFLFREYPVKRAVPVIFALLLVLVTHFFGRVAGLLCAFVGGLIFAVFLFEPYGSLMIRSAADRLELLVFALAATGVVYFSPGPDVLTKAASLPSTFAGRSKSSDRLETWIAVVGYAVVLTAMVTLLLNVLNSMRY